MTDDGGNRGGENGDDGSRNMEKLGECPEFGVGARRRRRENKGAIKTDSKLRRP